MVYSPNKVVACLKVDGKILREDKGVVTLPFGSEYSIFVKNLNPTRIKVRISVDGTDATEGCWLVVDPNSTLDLERFIKSGDMNRGNRFKFIERTKAVEEGPRGIKADDGLIRIESQVEIVRPKPVIVEEHHHHHHHDHYDYPWRSRPWTLGGLTKSSAPSSPLRARSLKSTEDVGFYSYEFPVDAESDSLSESLSETSATLDSAPVGAAAAMFQQPKVSDVGITVAGSESNQSFRWTAGFETGASEVIVLQLRGKIAEKPVVKAVTVETKISCTTCGKSHKSTEKFCGQCGTALHIL